MWIKHSENFFYNFLAESKSATVTCCLKQRFFAVIVANKVIKILFAVIFKPLFHHQTVKLMVVAKNKRGKLNSNYNCLRVLKTYAQKYRNRDKKKEKRKRKWRCIPQKLVLLISCWNVPPPSLAYNFPFPKFNSAHLVNNTYTVNSFLSARLRHFLYPCFRLFLFVLHSFSFEHSLRSHTSYQTSLVA